MAGKAAQLAIELTEKGASAVAGDLDNVTSSAKRMGDTVESAGKQAKSAGDRMDTAAGGADEMASKGSQAAGAMGGLGDLIGGPFGAAMATGGIGLQAMADSGDLLNAALENSIVTTARAKVGTIAKSVADKAAAGATKVMTVAQRALNVAQRASPIGLIITGVLLLVGGLILAYRHSARFRAIVDAAMRVAKAGVDKAVGAFKSLGPVVQKVMQLVARVVGTYVKIYITAFQLGLKAAQVAWKAIQAVVSSVVGIVSDKVQSLRDTLGKVWSGIKSAGVNAFKALIAPVQRIVDLVQSLIDKIKDIHIPHIDLNPFGRSAVGSVLARSDTPSQGGTFVTIPTTIQGGATAAQADEWMRAVDLRLRSLGRAPVFAR